MLRYACRAPKSTTNLFNSAVLGLWIVCIMSPFGPLSKSMSLHKSSLASNVLHLMWKIHQSHYFTQRILYLIVLHISSIVK